MSKISEKVLDFLGWEAVEEDVPQQEEKDEPQPPQFQTGALPKKQQPNKVVNIHSSQQFKVIIMQPENFDDAQEICEHLKNKKPVVINLEDLDKEFGQRILDFLSGGVCSLDGSIQKVSNGIFVIAPNNVDIMSEFKNELTNKAIFPWAR